MRRMIGVAAVVLVLAGCGGSDGSDAEQEATTTSTVAETPDEAACAEELRQVSNATIVYERENGEFPVNTSDLINAGLLRSAPLAQSYVITTRGKVIQGTCPARPEP